MSDNYTQHYDVFEVCACADTGDWLTEPVPTGESLTELEWVLQQRDDDHFIYESYEFVVTDERGEPTGHSITRWVRVNFVG